MLHAEKQGRNGESVGAQLSVIAQTQADVVCCGRVRPPESM